ncbi:UDP-glycosyltransferase 83A1-like [Primulina tabacum]|uniref:UDP-glycosyltransferase 83A1-like n=1 Tax=Primulina tabacum TaxID=48773 RepID=UPI003F59D847
MRSLYWNWPVLAKHGVQVTFVNLDIIHSRIVDTSTPHIHLVSISDGLESHEKGLFQGDACIEVWYDSMPQKVEQIIKENSVSEDEKFSCVISDQSLGRIQQVAKKMGIASVAFLPAAAASLVLGFNIQKMIENGIVVLANIEKIGSQKLISCDFNHLIFTGSIVLRILTRIN